MKSLFRKRKLPKVKSTESGKLDFLESVRGIAALAVVFAHILATYFPAAIVSPELAPVTNGFIVQLFYGLPFGLMVSGHFAVVVFFILSGFVLTYKFFQSRNLADLQKQLAKRFFRLAIPIFAIVVVAYLMLANGAMSQVDRVAELTGSPENMRIFNFDPSLTDALYDATIGVIVDGNVAYNPVLWTMQVEFAGSLIVFSLAALIGNLRRRWMVYVGALIFLNYNYLSCFILGMALADLVHNTRFIDYARTNISRFYAYAALGVVWILASFPYPDSENIKGTVFESLLIPGLGPDAIFNFWHFLAAFILLLVILVRLELQHLLSAKFLVFLGGISFGLYLTHYLILHSLGDSLYVLLRQTHGVNFAALIVAVAVILVTLLVSIFWKKYIDDMSVRVSRRFATYFLK